MYDFDELNNFGVRLAKIMNQQKVNARQLSCSLGLNESYITPILNGKTFPQMENFVRICKALNITPEEFFRYDDDSPAKTNELILDIRKLNYIEKQHVHNIIKDIIK